MTLALSSLLMTVALAAPDGAPAAPDAAALTQLLNEFLAHTASVEMHQRFWADDLIYTRAVGQRLGKAEVVRDVGSRLTPKPGEPPTTYAAEDVRIQQYGDTALVAFRLVATTPRDGGAEVARYLNTGVFHRREGRWQAVGWQATRMPPSEDDERKQVAAAEAALRRALLGSDVHALESLLDDDFVWTQATGEQMTRRQLLDALGSGRLNYSRLEAHDVSIAVHGDAAVVRGVWQTPSASAYTLTLVDAGDGWKAIAMQAGPAPEAAARPKP
jgi:ketosteroid isomerase-like protein